MSRVNWRLFPKIVFLPKIWRPSWTFAKNAFISDMVRDRAILTKFLTNRVSAELYQRIVFPLLLAAILNFCVKRKNSFISETVRDRVILSKFLTPQGIWRVYWQLFFKNGFPTIFGGHLELLRKPQKHIYLGNGAR